MADKKKSNTRNQTNPLFNDRKLKLGTFSTNLAYAGALTTVEGTHEATWPAVMSLTKMADEMEFEAIVPVARWRGFGGETNAAGPGRISSGRHQSRQNAQAERLRLQWHVADLDKI